MTVIAASLIIARRWKRYPPMDEWTDQMWSVHTVAHHPAKEQNTDSGYSMDEPESIMLREASRHRRTNAAHFGKEHVSVILLLS